MEAHQSPTTAVHRALDRFWTRTEHIAPVRPDLQWQAEFATAVGEVTANIVRHALGSGHASETFEVLFLLFPDRAEARFADPGVAYTPSPVPPASADDDLFELREGGWGLGLARAAVDELRYHRLDGRINQWLIEKKLP